MPLIYHFAVTCPFGCFYDYIATGQKNISCLSAGLFHKRRRKAVLKLRIILDGYSDLMFFMRGQLKSLHMISSQYLGDRLLNICGIQESYTYTPYCQFLNILYNKNYSDVNKLTYISAFHFDVTIQVGIYYEKVDFYLQLLL